MTDLLSRWVVVVGLVLVGVLSGCLLDESPNLDPRSYSGADSDVTLESALNDHGLKLPTGVAAVRFGAFSGREYSFHLSFDAVCSSVRSFLAASSINAPLEAGVVSSLVYSTSLSRGWEVERFRNRRGIEEDVIGVLHPSVLVVNLAASKCRVFVSSFK